MNTSKTVLITGCSSGIGKATARYFASHGWNVAATMRRPEKESELGGMHGIKLFRLDVTDEASIKSAVHEVMTTFGSIDVIVNNAAIATMLPFEAEMPAMIQQEFATNVFGAMALIREVLPHFRQKRNGTIVNVTSIGGLATFQLFSIYHSTKWALEGFSESLSFELSRFNIKVKIVEPGPTKSELSNNGTSMPQNDEALVPYNDFFVPFKKRMQSPSASAQSVDASVVAQTIFKAANDTSGKLRYGTTAFVKVFVFLRRMLPLSWFMGMMRRL